MNKKMTAGLIAVTIATTAGITFANGSYGDKSHRSSKGEGQQHSQMTSRGQGMSRAVNLDYIFGQLNLSEETQASTKAAIESFAETQRTKMSEQRSEMKDSETRPSAEERAALRTAHRAEATIALTDQLNTVLSPDQTAELVDYINAHMKNQEGGGQHNKGGKNR